MARSGDEESAFHNLLELGHAAVPRLEAVYAGEAVTDLRLLLIEVVWQNRLPTSLPFLARALNDPEPPIWKAALDGLVTLASPEAAAVLAAEAAREPDPERRTWIEEALEQVTDGDC
jgi:hypothetical protein